MKTLDKECIEKILTLNRDDFANLLSALSNEYRLIILSSMLDKPAEFSMLLELTGLSKTALAHHLKNLVENRLLDHLDRGQYQLTTDGSKFLEAMVTVYSHSQKKKEADAQRHAQFLSQRYSKKMKKDKLQVRFERLPPMRVAVFNSGLSKSPEEKTWKKLRAWAEPKGFLANLDEHPIYGFNNPSPSPGKKEYGYELWIKIPPDFQEEGLICKEIPEQLYSVTRCEINDPYKDIPQTWMRLVDWTKRNGKKISSKPCLEKTVSSSDPDDFIMDLYLPIKE
ncbi:MAG: ArsR family transcriptional regulator [Promethearchaeota archaeon]|nr:MAG: ArsR family transcriptional regulator [Candidatus Lokiarchaeota archaeon]